MSSTPYQGNLGRFAAPLTKSGQSPVRAITNLIGPPQQNFPFSADDVRSVETFTLQRLAEGKQDYIGFSITSAMQSANPSILEVMPMLETNAIEFQHEVFTFPKELAVQTPAQAPPGYVEVKKTSRSQTLTRIALAATTTVQELRTAEGQFIFRGKLITVAIGFIESAELMAMEALLETPSLYAEYYVKAGQHPIDLQRVGRMNDLYFDIMRRRDNGFSQLVDMVKQAFSQQRLELTHCIMSDGMRSLMMASPMMTEYFRHGPGAAQNARQLGDAVGGDFNGMRFVVIRAYEFNEKDLRLHPLERVTIIGQHFRLDRFHPQADYNRYTSKWMSAQVFSMENDVLATIGAKAALEFDGRFDAADGRLHKWHEDLRDNLSEYVSMSRVPIYQQRYDMFLYVTRDSQGSQYVDIAELWGHMEDWALSEETVSLVGQTSAKFVTSGVSPMELAAIESGLDDIRQLYEKVPSETDIALLESAGAIGPYGVPLPPSAGDITDGLLNYYPFGYGSVAGYLTLAQLYNNADYGYIDQGLIQRAISFKNATSKLHKSMISLYKEEHVALNPSYAPASYLLSGANSQSNIAQQRASYLNFMQNIVDSPKATIFLGGEGNGARVQYSDVDDVSLLAELNQIVGEVGAVPEIAAALGSDEDRAAFAQSFATSKFGRRYSDYLQKQNLSTEEAEAAADGNLFEKFFQNEVLKRSSNLERAVMLTRVIRYVGSKRAPRTIRAQELEALASTEGEEIASLLSGEQAEGRPTAFVASIDAVKSRDDLQLASPYNPTQVLDVSGIDQASEELADASGANKNLLRTTIFASAHAATQIPMAGVREASRSTTSRLTERAGMPSASFAERAYTDIAGDEIVVNDNIVRRYREAAADTHWLVRIVTQMFLLAPINKDVLLKFVRYNIVLPCAWLVEQFNRRYKTASMIFLRQPSSEPVGNIRYMDPDTHVGRNIINKNLTVHVSMEIGATVNDVQNWFVAHDTAVVDYLGGETTKPFDQDKWSINNLAGLGLHGESLLYFMVPAGSLIGEDEHKTPLEHDIRGYADAVNYSSSSVHRSSKWSNRPYFSSALFYTTKLNLNQLRTPTADDWYDFQRDADTFNTVTQQGFQQVVNPYNNNYEYVILPQDPFGESVYPGCKDLRNSKLARTYEPQNYKQRSIAV